MIFFRRLRQGYISEGKTKEYLLYAIGEIVLVVIGILEWKISHCMYRLGHNTLRK